MPKNCIFWGGVLPEPQQTDLIDAFREVSEWNTIISGGIRYHIASEQRVFFGKLFSVVLKRGNGYLD